MTDPDRKRLARNLQDELDNAYVYAAMAEVESRPELADVYRRLSETEARHAARWAELLGTSEPARPSWRARALAALARRFGTAFVLPTLAASEQANQHAYLDQPEAQGTPMAAEERSHALLLQTIADTAPRGVPGPALARLEGRHRAIGGNALRAAVLGANDGLVSNLSLVMGVAGAALSNQAILITGFAGLVAGAFSMAMGEWISVQSSRELYERQVAVEAEEITAFPDEEADELALVYQAKGLHADDARRLARHIMTDHERALDTMAREELGIDPEDLGGSPWTAAGSSFALFCVGAIVPVLPFIFLSGSPAVAVSLILSGLALFAIGGAITLVTGRPPLRSGLRQLLFGLAAAGITFAIGSLIDAAVG
jgi:VIT1/CCC1 family predicted Fe2+/Mn2+ transporter